MNLGCINGFIEPDRFVFRFPSKFGCSVDSLFFSKPSKDLGLLRGNPTLLCCFYRARYYDPLTGRFAGEDPFRFFAGEANFYSYVEQNPINLVDPWGLVCQCSYSQSTGHLKCVDDFGSVVAETNGYAGNGRGKNNPFFQTANSVGPLPRGNYMLGRAVNSPNTGPLTIPLTYIGGYEPFPSNRDPDSMRIHGDKKGKPPGNASEGCIVTSSADPRKKIADGCGPGSLLSVGP